MRVGQPADADESAPGPPAPAPVRSVQRNLEHRSLGSLAAPQVGQAADSVAPHERQNRRPSRFSVPHEPQII
jgi:hypothetical protein